jgi:hypothetical protein
MESYQTDTTLKSKKEFLNRLKVIDSSSYNNIHGLMELNEHDFPESFFITDIDKNGIQEYFLSEGYEGVLNLGFTFRNNKLVKFLDDIPYTSFLIESPQKIWLASKDSYLGWERNMSLLDLVSNVHCFNVSTFQSRFKFRLYEAFQMATSEIDLQNYELIKPASMYKPARFIINSSTQFFSSYLLPNQPKDMGTINKGSYGWILADTLNSYFAVFDSTTSYVNDSLGREKITYKDRGYMMCWIPKKVAEFSNESGISGLYEDPASKEYLRVVQTKDNLYINYFSAKSFERGLLIDSSDLTANKYTVRFKKGGEKYLLESKENYKVLECTNPNQKKQKFVRIE